MHNIEYVDWQKKNKKLTHSFISGHSYVFVKKLLDYTKYPSQETHALVQRTSNLNEYYESLRNNVITLLEHVRLPPNGSSPEKIGQENFDSYLSKLQTLCTPEGYCSDENRPLYETVKCALQDFTVLPTPI